MKHDTLDDLDFVEVMWNGIKFRIAYNNDTQKFSLVGKHKLPPKLKSAIQEWCLQFHEDGDIIEYLDDMFPMGNA